MLQAAQRSQFKNIYVELLPTDSPIPKLKFPSVLKSKDISFTAYEDAAKRAYYSDGGMPFIALNEVVILANNQARLMRKFTYVKRNDKEVMGYAEEGDMRLWNALPYILRDVMRYPPPMPLGGTLLIMIDNDRFYPEREHLRPIFLNIMRSQIESVSIINGAVFKHRGHVLYFKTKAGKGYVQRKMKTLEELISVGYTTPAQFYHPVYETDEQKANKKYDLRTTIYWNPFFKTDEDGNGLIEFYTPDNVISPNLVIEGISPEGIPVRFEQPLN